MITQRPEQMTLGALLKALENEPDKNEVRFAFGMLAVTGVDSYRGYYDQLAVGWGEAYGKTLTVAEFAAVLKQSMHNPLVGYKGGEFLMEERTPLWAANYGECPQTAIIGIAESGIDFLLETTHWD